MAVYVLAIGCIVVPIAVGIALNLFVKKELGARLFYGWVISLVLRFLFTIGIILSVMLSSTESVWNSIGAAIPIWIVLPAVLIETILYLILSKKVSNFFARYILDCLPGAQMKIDAELNNARIDENEAKRRRNELMVGVNFWPVMKRTISLAGWENLAYLIALAILCIVARILNNRAILNATSFITVVVFCSNLIQLVSIWCIEYRERNKVDEDDNMLK